MIQPEREFPLRFMEHPVTGEPQLVMNPEFTAWIMGLAPETTSAAEEYDRRHLPAELHARAWVNRQHLKGLRTAVEAYMRGELL